MPAIKKTTTIASATQTIPQSSPQTPPAAAPPPDPAATPPAAPATPAATPPDPQAALVLYVQQTVNQLDDVELGLGNDPALTPGQKRHALKFRKGGDKIIAQIGNLAQQQQLESPALNVTDMTATLGKAQALQPLSDRVAAFSKHVDDVIFKAESDSLAMAQQFYALLQRRALTDTELDTALAPVIAFFARKPKPKAAGALTKPQAKATAKAVKTLQKNAPAMLQGGAAQGTGVAGAAAASGTPGAPATADAGTAGTAGAPPAGNGAAGPAAPTGAS
ncbi:MAG: hypothetical protein ACRELB_01230, partial [Polyangiaceae bacterium]